MNGFGTRLDIEQRFLQYIVTVSGTTGPGDHVIQNLNSKKKQGLASDSSKSMQEQQDNASGFSVISVLYKSSIIHYNYARLHLSDSSKVLPDGATLSCSSKCRNRFLRF